MENHICKNSYFFGVNTSSGFKSCSEDIINGAERLYIIKGGPGTGKSRLMEDVAKAAEKKGFSAERFYCSSDPSSLDGVYFKELDVCLVDGTYPHLRDPIYPGAADHILNLSDFWSERKLVSSKQRIKELGLKKKELYGAVYSFMAASDRIFEAESSLLYGSVDHDKLKKVVNGIFRKKKTGEGYRLCERQTESVGMKGHVHFNSFEAEAESIISISDVRGIDYLIYDAITSELRKRNFTVYVSRDPLRKMCVNEIYVPELHMAVGKNISLLATTVKLNSERFILKNEYKEIKSKLRPAAKLRKDIEGEILKTFKEISAIHFELEKIYSCAMDFRKKEEFTSQFVKRLFE